MDLTIKKDQPRLYNHFWVAESDRNERVKFLSFLKCQILKSTFEPWNLTFFCAGEEQKALLRNILPLTLLPLYYSMIFFGHTSKKWFGFAVSYVQKDFHFQFYLDDNYVYFLVS